MAGILTLDTGMTTGWAFMARPFTFTHGIWKLPGGQKEPGWALLDLEERLETIVAKSHPSLIVKETAILPQNKNKQYRDTAEKLTLMYGLHGVVEMICCRHGIKLTQIEPRTLKKQFTDNGNATKEDMVFRCMTIGQPVVDHNEADAIALLVVTARKRVKRWPL